MKRYLLIGLLASLGMLTAGAQGPDTRAQAYVNRVARQEPLQTASWGVLAINSKGDTLAVWNPMSRMVPASNLKLITTAAALHRLGADFQFETSLAYTGVIEDGVLKGDLYIIGGGDPTLAAPDSIALSPFTLFSRWKGLLSSAGIRRIEGRIIGDGRYLDGAQEHPTWGWDDLGTDYGTGGNGLCFNENQKTLYVSPGKSAGDLLQVREGEPATPWMHYTCPGTTGKAGTGSDVYLLTSNLSPFGEIRGSLALGRGPVTLCAANKFGALTCASEFCHFLFRQGIEVSGGPADIDGEGFIRLSPDFQTSGEAVCADSLIRIGCTKSPVLAAICRETNHRSDNFYAETLLRMLGRRDSGADSYESSVRTEMAILRELGVDCSRGVRIVDGSGLSRQNNISPEFMVRFLSAMRQSPAWEAYLSSLPSPGSNGTMRAVLPALPAGTRQRIRLKSGSMTGVLCYSGYILPKNGQEDYIYFSILTNNADVSAAKMRPVITEIIARLAE